jgi:hypothetical protein
MHNHDQLKPYHFKPGQTGNPHGRGYDQHIKAIKTCKELGFDPIREAIIRYRDKQTPNASKDHCLKLIADRVLPSLKNIEVRGSLEGGLQQTVINILSGNVASPTIDSETQPLLEDAEI